MGEDMSLRFLRDSTGREIDFVVSVARNEAREDSDVDLLVEPSNQRFSIFDLVRVRDLCRSILGRRLISTTMTAFATYRNSGVASVAISSVSSNPPRGGRAAARAGGKALELVAGDTEISYPANSERQLAIERLLIRFSEALKGIPNQTLTQIDYKIAWAGPKGFRDIASHLCWHALVDDLPPMFEALQRWIATSDTQPPAPTE